MSGNPGIEPKAFSLEPLGEDREALILYATWGLRQWGGPGDTLGGRIARIERTLQTESQTGFIARMGNECVGGAMLVDEDLEERRDLHPWLGGVYVSEACRGLGVGSALVRAVEGQARLRGHGRLFLITPDRQAFYAALGWRFVAVMDRPGRAPITIMWTAP